MLYLFQRANAGLFMEKIHARLLIRSKPERYGGESSIIYGDLLENKGETEPLELDQETHDACRKARIKGIPLMPIGSVEFAYAVMRAMSIFEPAPITYSKITLRDSSLEGWSPDILRYRDLRYECFIKPYDRVKLFDGHIFHSSRLLFGENGNPDYADEYKEHVRLLNLNPKVYALPIMEFVEEWRFYFLQNKIIGFARYDDNEGGDEKISLHSPVLDLARNIAIALNRNDGRGFTRDLPYYRLIIGRSASALISVFSRTATRLPSSITMAGLLATTQVLMPPVLRTTCVLSRRAGCKYYAYTLARFMMNMVINCSLPLWRTFIGNTSI